MHEKKVIFEHYVSSSGVEIKLSKKNLFLKGTKQSTKAIIKGKITLLMAKIEKKNADCIWNPCKQTQSKTYS